jgi:hypothetical protein
MKKSPIDGHFPGDYETMFKKKNHRELQKVLRKGWLEAGRLYRRGYGPEDIERLQKPFCRRMVKANSKKKYRKARKRYFDLAMAKLMW